MLNVSNSGTVTGPADLTNDHGAMGTFTNEVGGIWNTCSTVAANVFNLGQVQVGVRQVGVPEQTVITGSFTQGAGGVTVVDTDFLAVRFGGARRYADRLTGC